MASTPSRSRQAIRMSLPFMAGPISARFRAAVFLRSQCFAHFILALWLVAAGCIKKPTTVASRGFLSKSRSASTSHGGIAGYGDYNGCDL